MKPKWWKGDERSKMPQGWYFQADNPAGAIEHVGFVSRSVHDDFNGLSSCPDNWLYGLDVLKTQWCFWGPIPEPSAT